MTGRDAPDPAAPEPAASAAQDWITVWHSEWAAMAFDRELHEAAARGAAAWATGLAAVLAAALPDAPGSARAAAPARAAPAVAAPDPRDAALAALQARVEQLERRLAGTAPGP